MSQEFWINPPWANGKGGYQMGLGPLPAEAFCAEVISAFEQNAKLDLLTTRFSEVVRALPESGRAQELLAEILSVPPCPSELTDWMEPLSDQGARSLVTSALRVPEDLCLMQKDQGEYRLVAACVCAPSHWALAEKIGKPLEEIHEEVEGLNKALAPRMRAFFNKLPAERVFVRRNWLLHSDDTLFHPQPEVRQQLSTRTEAEALIVRSETQMLKRLDEHHVVFSIGVKCYPLVDIYAYPAAAKAMKEALLSRTDEEREEADQPSYEHAVLEMLELAATDAARGA